MLEKTYKYFVKKNILWKKKHNILWRKKRLENSRNYEYIDKIFQIYLFLHTIAPISLKRIACTKYENKNVGYINKTIENRDETKLSKKPFKNNTNR